MKTYPVILTENFFTLIADKDYSITKTDERFSKAIALYKAKKFTDLLDLLNRPAAIERFTLGRIKVYNGVLTYDGVEVHNVVATRIIQFLREGLPFKPLVAFLNNLFDNVSDGVREKLYSFMELNHLAITNDGNIIVFKMVGADGSPPSYPGSTFFELQNKKKPKEVTHYRIGHTYTFPREKIEESTQDCSSQGLYVGNRSFWNRDFDEKNNYTGSGRLLIAEVRPQDVCNVARSESAKMVVCKMKIIGEYKRFSPLVNKAVVSRGALGYKPNGQRFHNVRVGGKFAKA